MGRWTAAAVAIIFALSWSGCGGHKPPGSSPFPARITLNPAPSTSVQLGGFVVFTATAQNSSNGPVNPGFTFHSSDTSILSFAAAGIACAGTWNSNFTVCNPGPSGTVQVTATALGASSAPTLVFVHPPIDNITVTLAPPTTPPPTPTPCISMGQNLILQANAFSQNSDVTASVGTFTFSATNSSVVKIKPIVDPTLNVATNQVTVTAANPGLTQIFATASGVSSGPFVQTVPNFGTFNFFETCPVQSISLQLGKSATTQTGETNFATTKGTSEPVIATVFDILGNELTKAPLTWSSSNPVAVASTSCNSQSCTVTTPNAGSGTVTASCGPPTCNIGFPFAPVPVGLPPQFVPVPVYSVNPISGLVASAGNTTTTATSVLATSSDCKDIRPQDCTTFTYNVSSSKSVSGTPTPLPSAPNSILFDHAGDKAYVGSRFGAFMITPASLGGSGNPFTSFAPATGTVLAVSPNGSSAIFSDVKHTPNQVYVTGTGGITSLAINGAVAAEFSPDNLKAYILGCNSALGVACNTPAGAPAGNTLYVFSTLQSLQTIPLTAPATAVTFSSTGAFAFVNGGSSGSTITTFNTCDNSLAPLTISLPSAPTFLKVLPPGNPPTPIVDGGFNQTDVLLAFDGTRIDLIETVATVPAPVVNVPASGPSCPQGISLAVSNPVPPFPAVDNPLFIVLNQGTLQPIGFFLSPDDTLAYIVSSNLSTVLVYNFSTGSFSGIPIANNPSNGQPVTPVAASMSNDGSLIFLVGSDGLLHQLSTNPPADLTQISFPTLPNVTNSFCSNGATAISCALNLIAVKP
ncbi:MAG TPA: hypothetical protein VFO39_07020 [Candidatus Sulfotelmatobacter sp.]|nr:hypothetical protein [Candidatus Sulfotelmatobacter sp.]